MTKWLVTRVPSSTRWQLVSFPGPGGRESTGIVDLMAVRKDHSVPATEGLKRGDLLKIVLLQIKGGSARWPTPDDIRRLQRVKRHHRAEAVVLAEWHRGSQPTLYRLPDRLRRDFDAKAVWQPVEPEEVFGSAA